MKLKKLVFLILILVLLFSAVLIKKYGIMAPKSKSEADTAEASLMTESFTKAEIRKVSVTHPSGVSIVLSKQEDGSWKIDNQYGVPTRKNAVDDFLDQIWKVRGEIRAEKTDVLADFGLTDKTAINIRLDSAAADKFQEVYLSTKRPRGSQNFVRLANASRVLVTNTDILATLNIFSEDDKLSHRVFADFRPAGIEVSTVESLEINSAAIWSRKDGAADIDEAKINEFLSSLYNLYANDVADPAVYAKDFTGQSPWIRLQWKNGDKLDTFALWLGAAVPDKKVRIIKVDPSGIVYELPEAQLEPLLKKNKESFVKQKGA